MVLLQYNFSLLHHFCEIMLTNIQKFSYFDSYICFFTLSVSKYFLLLLYSQGWYAIKPKRTTKFTLQFCQDVMNKQYNYWLFLCVCVT